jgi:hypothetical protein
MPTKRPLGDPAISGPRKGEAHMLQFIDRLDRLVTHKLDGVLVSEIVGSFHCIVGMPLGVIFFFASQGCAYASLGGSSVRASGIQLAEYSRACRSRGVQGSHETGAASPDDDDVKLVGSHAMIPGPPSQGHDKNKGKRKILPDYYNLTYSIDIDFYRKKRLAGIDFFNKSIAGRKNHKATAQPARIT